MVGLKHMTNRWIAVMLICLLGAVSACTSSATSSVQTGSGSGYDSQYRGGTTSTQGQYEQKTADKKETDSAITVMQFGMETGDLYPGEDYYAYAVIDNPDARKNLEYVW